MSFFRAIQLKIDKFKKKSKHKKHCHCHVCYENRKGHQLKRDQEDTYESMKELSEI